MRTLAMFLILATCVTLAQASDDTTAKQAELQEDSPAFVAELHVSLPAGDSTPGSAISLVEDLREIANLDAFDLSLRMSQRSQPHAYISATFTFQALEEVLEWHRSDSVQDLLSSFERASDKPVELRVRGKLSGE